MKKNKKNKLDILEKKCLNEIKDELSLNATNLVFGKGNCDTKILFIGEAPGEKEDLSGIPFVGRAGNELNKMLNKINLTLEDCYITNILKYKPPKNRNPNKKEIEEHTPYLIEQIKIIKPLIIATLGNYSTKFILSGFEIDKMKKIKGISELRGKLVKLEKNDFKFLVFPIYHPAATLYRPKLKEVFEKDFLQIKKIIRKKLTT